MRVVDQVDDWDEPPDAFQVEEMRPGDPDLGLAKVTALPVIQPTPWG